MRRRVPVERLHVTLIHVRKKKKSKGGSPPSLRKNQDPHTTVVSEGESEGEFCTVAYPPLSAFFNSNQKQQLREMK
jgi:hypothetical protein